MKVVMLCDLYDEALQYQENLLAKYYAKHGHDVTVVASTFESARDYSANRSDRRGRVAREYQLGRVKVMKLPYSLNLLNRLRRFAGVDRILASERPDLIFVHDIHLNLPEAAQYRASHPTSRLVMDYHADYSNSARNWFSLNVLHKIIRRGVLYRYKQWIDRIYPVVPASASFLHEVYGIPLEELELLPMGADVDLARSVRSERAGSKVRSAYRIPHDAIVIFTGGKLNPLKKTDLLIEAFKAVRDPRLHLLVVGDVDGADSSYRRRLDELAADETHVHFTGWVDGGDVYRYMNACDFAVFPASQSVLWQQALSMGLPLVVGQVGVQDCSYMNRYGSVTLLRESEIRSDVIADNIRELMGNMALLKERQAGALRVTDELFNYDAIVSKTLALCA